MVTCSWCANGGVLTECLERTYTGKINTNYLCKKCVQVHNVKVCSKCNSSTVQEPIYDKDGNVCKELCWMCEKDEFAKYEVCHRCSKRYEVGVITLEEDTNYRSCPICKSNLIDCDGCPSKLDKRYNSFYKYRGFNFCFECKRTLDSNCEYHRYDYKPYPVTVGKVEDGLYLGVELEIDNGTVDKERAVEDLSELSKFVYMKHDGSLNYGFEIVSHPTPLKAHEDKINWNSLISLSKDYGYKADTTETCGLHIHASKGYFRNIAVGIPEEDEGRVKKLDYNLAKLLILFDKFWNDYIVPFSRRDLGKMRRWAKKNNTNYDIYFDDFRQMANNISDQYNDKYQAINILNNQTIEFRIFKGTLDYNILMAALQFVDVTMRFVANHDMKTILGATWDSIYRNTGHKELEKYLDDIGL